jgi:hypothetical protein
LAVIIAAKSMAMKSNFKKLILMVSLLTWISCQRLGSPKPISVRTLAEEYERSVAAVRGKYDGKEIIVSGYAMISPMLPSGDDQGSVQLEEKDQPTRKVVCWFSKEQVREFSKITVSQYVTVKGVFNGEAGVELKFCKLVSIEVKIVQKGGFA